ncbi:sugar phosphate isomerase/epimerase family protein [Planctomycetota bacterium]
MPTQKIERRTFLKYSAAAAAAGNLMGALTAAAAPQTKAKWRKGIKINMLPKNLTDAEKFQLAKKCGFEGIDAVPLTDMETARKQAQLARDVGIPIHGVVFGWWPPFDKTAGQDKKCLDDMENALRCAQAMNADTVLLVPTRLTETFGYADAYQHSQKLIRKLIPLAEELKIIIAIENVWNKFLLSPLEFARYLDELESPWVRAYFDVGNVIIHGFAQDWIRTLGKRIIKLDLKDFKRQGYEFVNLLDGDVNWPEVRKALNEIGFEGWMTAELRGGDEAYLTDLSQRIDRIIKGIS